MRSLANWLPLWGKTITGCLLLMATSSHAQELTRLTLQEAWTSAETNFPFVKQRNLLRQTEALTIRNLDAASFPQLVINGQATYQSDVTIIDVPGRKDLIPTKDQYRITGDLNQLIYDGGAYGTQKDIQRLSTRVEESKLDVQFYELKDRITKLFFAILYQDELLKQSELMVRDVQLGIEKTQPQVEQALVLRSNLQVLQAQHLVSLQRVIEIRNTRKGYTDALSILINRPISSTTELVIPNATIPFDATINRPELKLFREQAALMEAQLQVIRTRNFPKISLFVQGGYGRPGLNQLSNLFDFFYIGGIRFNWSITNYNNGRDRRLAETNVKTVQLQQETFLLNTNSQLQQINADILKYSELLKTDQGIIDLRNQIVSSAKIQLENAVITANDYLRELNAADQARQALSAHQLLLRQAYVNYQVTTGKL